MLSPTLLTILICCMVAASQGRQFPCTSTTSYDPDTQICCNGAVVAKEENLACCSGLHGSGQLYNTSEKICCGEKVLDRTEADLQCCADQPFNPSTSVCCSGKLHQREAEAVCCGESYLNTAEYLCCHDRYNRSQEMFMKREPGLNLRCCGNKPYNPEHKKCSFYKNVIDKTFDECGRGKIFDMTKNKCCNGELHNVPALDTTLQCCYRGYYNVTEQKCCDYRTDSYLIANSDALECCRSSDTEGFIHKATEICCASGRMKRTSNLTLCCGSETYEYGKEDCCGGKFVYNPLSQRCCPGGGQNPVADKNTTCCGGRGLKEDEMCCRSQPVKKGEKDRDDCSDTPQYRIRWPPVEATVPSRSSGLERCGRKNFDPKTAVCCGNEVYKFGKGQTLGCCGVKSYDKAQYECPSGELRMKTKNLTCNGKPYTDALPSEKCCGSGIQKYNEDNQICCENGVFNMSSNEASCCNGKAYSMNEKNPCFEYCGSKPFSPTKQTCCGDKLYKGKHKCCGNQRFRPKTQVCCPGGLLVRKKEARCCGPFPFSKKFASCDRPSKTLNTRGVTTTDLLCKGKKARRNFLNASPAACALPTVLKGTVERQQQKEDSLTLTLTNVQSLSLPLGGGFQGKVPSRLHLELAPSPGRCRLRRNSELIVMLPDNGPEVDRRQDLRGKAHYVMVYSSKTERVLKRSLNAGWCKEVCRRLRKTDKKLLGIDKCYRSVKDL